MQIKKIVEGYFHKQPWYTINLYALWKVQEISTVFSFNFSKNDVLGCNELAEVCVKSVIELQDESNKGESTALQLLHLSTQTIAQLQNIKIYQKRKISPNDTGFYVFPAPLFIDSKLATQRA